ncbi:MAG: hypothetical protein ACFB6R_16295 [Alphaproteobacteria bacterium]
MEPNLIEVFITAFAGAIGGGFAGFVLGLRHSKHVRRETRTNELISEFFSNEMIDLRRRAYEAIQIFDANHINASDGIEVVLSQMSASESSDVRKVMEYLNKLSIFLNAGLLDRRIIRMLLKYYIKEWIKYLSPIVDRENNKDQWKELAMNIDALRRI